MYVVDVKKEFYDYIIGKHIVIIVHHDVDAVCTCRILQTLIKYDSIQYTLIPVQGLRDLKTAYEENFQQVKNFVLINCGATLDLVELLDPPEDTIFFILDSHRPTDVCNIYSTGQVRLLWPEKDDKAVPEFDDIFRDDDEDEEEQEEQNEDDSAEEDAVQEGRESKRRRLDEAALLKRRERRLWEEKRNKLMFEYSEFSYYGNASAITFYELAHTLAKDTKELLWFALVGLSSQQILAQVETVQYSLVVTELQMEVERLNRKNASDSRNTSSTAMQLIPTPDLQLSLFRHWTIEKSITCSMYTLCKMKLWSKRGERRLQELLADMGLPIVQSKQRFAAMDMTYRNEFVQKVEECGAKYGLTSLTYPSFMTQFGYRLKFVASDVVHILVAILEQSNRNKSPQSCFGDALDFLSRPPPANLLTLGLDGARLTLENCYKILKASLDQRKIFSAGPFLYFILCESLMECYMFSRPQSLSILGRYIQQGYSERQGARASSTTMPLLISAPIESTETSTQLDPSQTPVPGMDGMCVLLGLPPLSENSPKSFFGKAFEQAAEKSNAICHLDYFDTSYVQLRISDRTRFLDSLTALLS